MKTPPGVSGTIINTKLFSRKRDELISRKEEKKRVEQEQERHAEKLAELNQQWADKMYSLLRDKTSPGVLNYSNVELIPKGEKYKNQYLKN